MMQALLNLREVKRGQIEKDSAYYLSIATLTILILELLGLSVFLKWNRKELDKVRHKNRCGYIF